MDKQLKKIYLYMGIFVAIIFIGATYAFFTAGMSSETSTTVRADAGTMKITYDGGANITLSGIYPRDEVWATKNITVTGNNTTDAEMYYKLTLVVDSNTFKTSDPLQYELVSTNTSMNGKVIPAVDKTDITESTIELGNGHFAKANNARHTYQLKIYYSKKTASQNDNQSATFSAHVEITSVKPSIAETLADMILASNEIKTPITTPGKEINNHTKDDITYTLPIELPSAYQSYYVTYGTGWEANGDKFNLTGTAVTTDTYANSYSSLIGNYLPMSEEGLSFGSTTAGKIVIPESIVNVIYVTSATDTAMTVKLISSNKNTTEALLASTEDNYGTSYYFRGAVKNNYVQFANKCWRVVRISGDGSIKLALHNNNTFNVSNPCASVNNTADAAFIGKSAYNSDYGDNAYIGFMYGQTGTSDYTSTHVNTNKSTILTNLETWYENNLATYEDKISNTVWCNDKNIVTDATFSPAALTSTMLGYGYNMTYYESEQRLVNKDSFYAGGTGPSLKCNGELSNITTKIGLLTADELAFTGYASKIFNTSSYLQENANGSYWWSLSPGHYGGPAGGGANIWYIQGETGTMNVEYVSKNYGVRPAISLISTVEATGSGTSEDPYVVK